VVISGQFLIDSEANVNSALERIAPEARDRQPSETDHATMDQADMDHSGHDMSGATGESGDDGGKGP
jgi:hypothetical protein